MRRIAPSLSVTVLAVIAVAFAACSKAADTSPDAALKAAATGKSTAKAPDTKPADTKPADAKATANKAADAKSPATKVADAKAPATKTANTKAPATKAAETKAPATQTQAAPAASKPATPAPMSKPAPQSAPLVAVSGGTIDPGMTKAQVVALLGHPASDRARGDFTYLLFANGIEKQVGMSDLVVLQSDKVVDAVLRAPNRSYSGTSSSPRAIPSAEAAKSKPKGGT